MTDLTAPISTHPLTAELAKRLQRGRETFAQIPGGNASTVSLLCTALSRHLPQRPILLVVAHSDDADEAIDELAACGFAAQLFPALEVLPGETGVSPELLGQRLALVASVSPRLRRGMIHEGVAGGDIAAIPRQSRGLPEMRIIVAPIPALMQSIPKPERLDSLCLNLAVGDSRGPGAVLTWLEQAGYRRAPALEEPGQFAVRGGVIDIFPAGGAEDSPPVRLDFFGDEIEHIYEVDPDTLATDRRIKRVQIVGASVEALLRDDEIASLMDVLPSETVVILHELMEVTEQGRGYYERAISGGSIYGPPAVLASLRRFAYLQVDAHPYGATDPDATFLLPVEPLPRFAEEATEAVGELVAMAEEGQRVIVCCANDGERQRFEELVGESRHQGIETSRHQGVESVVAYLHRGIIWDPDDEGIRRETASGVPLNSAHGVAYVPYHELLHRFHTRRRIRRVKHGRAMDAFLEIQPGDYVVHRDHGIARFVEIATLRIDKTDARRNRQAGPQEYLTLEFASKALLHVPASKIDFVQKYVGGHDGRPPLSTLGGKRWNRQKEDVREAVRDLAAEMLRLQAARAHLPGIRYPNDTSWQTQFEAEFPYEETPDQIAALSEIKKDMHDARPMDRLLCGDVGFGKTELAIRAAFKAAEYGRQVAVLVPTTVLAEQHYRTFRHRFADYPFRVEVISRFQTATESRRILDDLKAGRVDVIIGTHRLLSKDVKFADLGLVIVDEEQRFGVEHKQRLLQFRLTADVLTLSATPIPRTLHMSLLGIRDISSLTTPPLDRRAVVTEVIPYNERRVQQAIQRELAREGQVYFVHNKVYDIKAVAERVQALVPDARVIVGHGQMPDRELERVMLRFIRHEADILVSTTIIESGIDIPNANTMFINEAENFGLADLHQLRGRVGRYKHRAYCYLLLSENKAVSSVAAKRLRAIEEYSMLGAGFKIAMRDLELRGAGNILGAEQSGHIAAVGYEMYCHLLETAVKDLKNEPDVRPIETEVDLHIDGSIPHAYIPSDLRRLEAYRRISQARSVEDLNKVERELTDAYGSPPATTQTLLQLSEVRILAALLGVKSLVRHEQDIIFRAHDPQRIASLLKGAPGTVRLVEPRWPSHPHEVYYRPPENYLGADSLLSILRRRLAQRRGEREAAMSLQG